MVSKKTQTKNVKHLGSEANVKHLGSEVKPKQITEGGQEEKEVAENQGSVPTMEIPDGIDIDLSSSHANKETIEMADQALPWLKVAQKLTPELDDEEEFPDLDFGDLFLPTGEVWKAKEGVIFIPFFYGRTYVEWIPRNKGGGFVDDHGLTKGKELAKTCTRAENKKVATILPNGNDLIETAYWAGFTLDEDTGKYEQAIFAMTSSFLAVSKGWNTRIMKYRLGGAKNYIRFARPWRITTERQEDAANQVWATPKVSLYKPEDHEGVFHTFDLPEGVLLWKECDRLALEFKEGFRLQPPEGEGEVKPTQAPDNEAVPPHGDEEAPY